MHSLYTNYTTMRESQLPLTFAEEQLLALACRNPSGEIFCRSDDNQFLFERKDLMKRATRNKISRALKGKIVPRSVRKQISDSMKGHSNFEGNHHDPDTIRVLRRERGHDDRVRGRKWRTEVRTGEETRVYRLGNNKKYRWGRALSEWLSEARQPQLPTPSAIEVIDRAYHNADSLNGLDVINSFVTSTSDKNLVTSTANISSGCVPLGIYAFPSEYVLRQVDQHSGSEKLQGAAPVVNDQKYITVFSVSGNIIDLSAISQNEVGKYLTKLPRVIQQCNTLITTDEVHYHIDRLIGASVSDSPGVALWTTVSQIVTKLVHNSNVEKTLTKVYKELGIDGLYDNGDAIINPDRPYQLVLFSKSSVFGEQSVENSLVDDAVIPADINGSSHDNFKRRVDKSGTGETFEHLVRTEVFTQPKLASDITDKYQQRKLIAMCNRNNITTIVAGIVAMLSDDLLVSAIRLNPRVLRLIEHPSRSLLIAVGTSNPPALAELNATVSPDQFLSLMEDHPDLIEYLPSRFKYYFETSKSHK